MQENIHPAYTTAKVHCACGATWETRSTAGDLHLDICSNCHPFFTGKQKLMDTQGRIDRFNKKYANAPKGPAKPKAQPGEEKKGLTAKPEKPAKPATEKKAKGPKAEKGVKPATDKPAEAEPKGARSADAVKAAKGAEAEPK